MCRMDELIDGLENRQVHRWVGRQIDERTDGWMDRWMDRWVGGRTDGWRDSRTQLVPGCTVPALPQPESQSQRPPGWLPMAHCPG